MKTSKGFRKSKRVCIRSVGHLPARVFVLVVQRVRGGGGVARQRRQAVQVLQLLQEVRLRHARPQSRAAHAARRLALALRCRNHTPFTTCAVCTHTPLSTPTYSLSNGNSYYSVSSYSHNSCFFVSLSAFWKRRYISHA